MRCDWHIQIRGVIVAEARIEPTQAETEEGEGQTRGEQSHIVCSAGRARGGWMGAVVSHARVVDGDGGRVELRVQCLRSDCQRYDVACRC